MLPPAPDAIELRHLRAFVAVAEELNFGRAATRLFVSQPALSRQIRGLERLVGCDLLRRTTHRVELTLAGDALLDRARRLLSDLDDAVYATRSVGGDLERRLAAVWEPINDLTAASPDLQALRDAGEQLHGQFELAPGISVRPVIAGGVPSLLVTPAAGGATDGPAAARRRLRDGLGVRLPAPGQRGGRGGRHRGDRARFPARPGAPVPGRAGGRAAHLRLDARQRRAARSGSWSPATPPAAGW